MSRSLRLEVRPKRDPLSSPARTSLERPVNKILCSLTHAEYVLLRPDLEAFPLVVPTVLYASGQVMDYVYFPELGVVSLVTEMIDGNGVEAATIGNEGVVGLPVFFGQTLATARWIVQVADGSQRMPRAAFLAHVEAMPHLRVLVGNFAAALLDEVAQGGACNALHAVGARCARWLLMTHDRMGRRADFYLTQQFLSEMLGVRRPSVTIVAGLLQSAGLIRYRRGHIEVLDRQGLEDAACECYRIIRDRFERSA